MTKMIDNYLQILTSKITELPKVGMVNRGFVEGVRKDLIALKSLLNADNDAVSQQLVEFKKAQISVSKSGDIERSKKLASQMSVLGDEKNRLDGEFKDVEVLLSVMSALEAVVELRPSRMREVLTDFQFERERRRSVDQVAGEIDSFLGAKDHMLTKEVNELLQHEQEQNIQAYGQLFQFHFQDDVKKKRSTSNDVFKKYKLSELRDSGFRKENQKELANTSSAEELLEDLKQVNNHQQQIRKFFEK